MSLFTNFIIRHRYSQLIIIFLISFQFGCKKFIQVSPPVTSINGGNVYLNETLAASVLTGIYTTISDANRDFGSSSDPTGISLFQGMYGDELTLYNINDSRYNPFYTNSLTALTTTGMFWTNLYSIIFTCNSAIDGLNNSPSLYSKVRSQLLGEAKFVRAFCYFYLVNLYAKVPLVVTTDYKTNSQLAATAAPKIYDQIVSDLKDASNLLSEQYLKSDALTPYAVGAEERVRPTKFAAEALLARVYLYTGDYANAEIQASNVINKSSYSLNQLNDVFKKNSTETIWALQPVGTDVQANTGEGRLFILPSTGPNPFPNFVYLSSSVFNSFENGDQRRLEWIDSVFDGSTTYYFPYKYKLGLVSSPTEEYIIILRLSELYLIRAEARTQQGEANAVNDLNAIRNRAGLLNYVGATDKPSLLAAIMHERQVELFTEWGHRWFDLKRSNALNTVMTAVCAAKGGTWSPNKAVYPIPQTEIDRDHNLSQNPGY